MIVLADSDVVRKLAYCEMLDVFLQVMGVPPDEMWVLPALRYQLASKLNNLPGPSRNFANFCSKVKTVPPADATLLAKFSNLDVGEQQLFALLCGDGRVRQLVTGDKKAIAKAANVVRADPQVLAQVQEKPIWCFESIVRLLLLKRGFSVLNAAMSKWRNIPGLQMDGVMEQVFRAGCTELTCARELDSCITALEAQASGLVLAKCS